MARAKEPRPKAKAKAPRGRPSKYKPEFAEQAFKLALLGLTDDEMAKFFAVSQPTFDAWKRTHPEFLLSLTRGKDGADAEVAASLFERARGYSHPAVKIFMPAGAQAPVYADYTEHYPPDTAAAALWLANRQRGRWSKEPGKTDPEKDAGEVKVLGGLPED